MSRAGFVLRQLRARPLRTALTAAAFAVSVGLLGFLMVLNDAMQQDWSQHQGQRIIVMAKTSMMDKLPLAYLSKIEATPGVQRVVPFDFLLAFWKDSRPENQVPLQGVIAEPFLEVYLEADLPPSEVAAWMADPTGCVVGTVLARKFGWKVGDRIVLKAPVKAGAVETTVRGVLRYKGDNGVYLHRKYLEGITGEGNQVGMYWILAKTRGDVAKVSAVLDHELENAPIPARAMSEKQWQLQFMEMLGNVKLLLGAIGMATAFTLLLVTANSLAMSARERRGESALLRVLGFPRSQVAGFLLGEASLYGIAGGLGGIGLIYLFSLGVGRAIDETQMAGLGALLVPRPVVLIVAVVVSAGLAVLAGVIPTLNLTRRSIVELLRERG